MPWGSRAGAWHLAPADGIDADVVGRQGNARGEMQDSWAVAARRQSDGQGRIVAAGVFDGVGGHEHGRDASRAAAKALRSALKTTQEPSAILGELSPRVAKSGGYSTGLLVLAREGEEFWDVAWRGDGTAWIGNPGEPWRRVAGKPASRQPLDSFLGSDTPTHEARVRVEPNGCLALATDGVPSAWLDAARAAPNIKRTELPPHGDDDAMMVVLHRRSG